MQPDSIPMSPQPVNEFETKPIIDGSAPSTDSKVKKPRAKPGDNPHPRRQAAFLESARTALVSWRSTAFKRDFAPGPYSVRTIMSDNTLCQIASKQKLRLVSDFEKLTRPPWDYAQEYGAAVVAVLEGVDNKEYKRRAINKKRKAEEKKAASIAAELLDAEQAYTDAPQDDDFYDSAPPAKRARLLAPLGSGSTNASGQPSRRVLGNLPVARAPALQDSPSSQYYNAQSSVTTSVYKFTSCSREYSAPPSWAVIYSTSILF